MARQIASPIVYESVEARRILNIYRHADSWFWTKYSAYPYIGCYYGCEYCYQRSRKYLGHDRPEEYSRLVRVNANAAERLREELARVPVDILAIGDYQPAESRWRLSRRMLEVALDLGFPVFLMERSPLVLRDLDLILESNRRSFACVVFSIETVDEEMAKLFGPLAPSPSKRLAAMEQVAAAGILTGTALMPVMPGLNDAEQNLEQIVRATRDSGGSFVLGGGLTLEDQQRDYFIDFLRHRLPNLVPLYQRLYVDGTGFRERDRQLGNTLAALCQRYGIADRMPRYVPRGRSRTNLKLSACLHDLSYRADLKEGQTHRSIAYRRAAWALEELDDDVVELYRKQGRRGLEGIRGIGQKIATAIAGVLEDATTRSPALHPQS